SLDLVRKYPLARSRIFLRLARRLVPRFTRGIAVLLFYLVWRLEVRRLLPDGISEARPLHAPLRCVSLRRLGCRILVKDGQPALSLPKGPSLHSRLVRDHAHHFFKVCVAHQHSTTQMFLALLGLGGQDVAEVRLVPLYLSRPGFFQTL